VNSLHVVSNCSFLNPCFGYHIFVLRESEREAVTDQLLSFLKLPEIKLQGEGDNKFRFFTSAIDATILPLSICLCGEMLSTEVCTMAQDLSPTALFSAYLAYLHTVCRGYTRLNYRIIVNTVQCDSICRYLLPLHVSVS
jgi:hypothetical protein